MSAESDVKEALRLLCGGLPVNPVPPRRHRDETLPHAPTRTPVLNAHQQKVRTSWYADVRGTLAVCTNVTVCCCCWTAVHHDDDDDDDGDVGYFSHRDNDKYKHQKVKVKSKEGYSSLQASLPSPLRELTYAIWDHTVLPASRQR